MIETTTDRKSIWVFTPSRTEPKDLEFIFVQRQRLLRDAVERVKESALTDNKHHLLFVGSRGCGKTHLVTLVVSRLSEDDELTDRLRIAWLNEDETCTTLLELLLKVHAALEKRYPKEFSSEMLIPAYDLKQGAALDFVSSHLLSALGSRTLLVVTENLDALFEGLGDAGQKQLRSFIQENPKLSIVATAQRLVEDLSSRNSPFFGFFQTEHLKPLNVEQATELLKNIASLQEKRDVVEFLGTSRGRSRVRAIHHLSGGNHRIYIVLSQFITRDTVDALLEPFMKMVDELTPYYQERIRWLPPMQRKIVEYLCVCEGTVPVKEIARRLFATPQTISSQLQDLRAKGYVEAHQRGRESLYEISEPLMRICVEVKDNQRHQPLRLLVDFLRVWYEDHELKDRLGKMESASSARAYLESAIQRNSAEGNLRKQILLEDVQSLLLEKLPSAIRDGMMQKLRNAPEGMLLAMQSIREQKPADAIDCIDEAIVEEASPDAKGALLLMRAHLHASLKEPIKEIADYTAVIELPSVSVEQLAMALVNRGLIHGQAGEVQCAVADFTAVIELPGAPVEQLAMALVNRGVTYGQAGDVQREIADYTAVIELPGVPVEQLALTRVNRGIARGQAGEAQRAMVDFTAVIELPGAPVEQLARALANRGVTHGLAGDAQRAIADFTAVVELPGAPVEQRAMALVNRGLTHRQAGDAQREIADYTAVIELPGVPAEQLAKAFFNRGLIQGLAGDTQHAIADFSALIELPGAPVGQLARALVNRGLSHGLVGDASREVVDYTAVIDLPGAPVEQLAMALVNRGIAYGRAGDTRCEIADYTAVIDLPGAPVEQLAMALVYRGLIHGQVGEAQRAIADFTAVVELPGAPVEQRAMALVNRGIAHGQAGDTQCEIADYTAVIDLPGAPLEQLAMALVYRGLTHGQAGDAQREIADYTAVIDLPGAPVEQVATALVNRGIACGQAGDAQREVADYTAVIELPSAPVEQVAKALYSRAVTHFQKIRKQESQADFEALIGLPAAPVEQVVEAQLALSELHFSEGRWSAGFQALGASLEAGGQTQPAYRGSATDLVGVVFSAGLNPDGRFDKVTGLLRAYCEHNALSVLGEAVVQHIGSVFRTGEPFPASDNLEGWGLAWEQAAETVPDFRLSVRLLRTGIDFVKTGGKDLGVLLTLTSPERTILEQALGLANNNDARTT